MTQPLSAPPPPPPTPILSDQSLSSSHMRIDVSPGDDLQTDRTCWTIQTHSDEVN